jgi:hypothetical protein
MIYYQEDYTLEKPAWLVAEMSIIIVLFVILFLMLVYMTKVFLIRFGYYYECNLLMFYILSFTLTICRIIFLCAVIIGIVAPKRDFASKLTSLFDILSHFAALCIGLV